MYHHLPSSLFPPLKALIRNDCVSLSFVKLLQSHGCKCRHHFTWKNFLNLGKDREWSLSLEIIFITGPSGVCNHEIFFLFFCQFVFSVLHHFFSNYINKSLGYPFWAPVHTQFSEFHLLLSFFLSHRFIFCYGLLSHKYSLWILPSQTRQVEFQNG